MHFFLDRVAGTGNLPIQISFNENPIFFRKNLLKRTKTHIFLSLHSFKKYWLPLLFWVGVLAFGLLPVKTLKTGSQRTTKKLTLVYKCSFAVFSLVVFRLIFFVLPHCFKGPKKHLLSQNGNLFVFNIRFGHFSYLYFFKFLKFFMKKFRFSVYNNCVGRFFLVVPTSSGPSQFWTQTRLLLFINLIRLPVFYQNSENV